MVVAIAVLMEACAHRVWSLMSTIGVTITTHASHAGAGWEGASGAEAQPSASNIGTRAWLGPAMILPARIDCQKFI